MRGSSRSRASAPAPRGAAEPLSPPAERLALVCRKGQVTLERSPIPALGPGDALIRVRVAGLCRTDCQVAAGLLPAASPVILGHEIAGEVVALGEAVSAAVAVGDVVTVDPRIPCGACPSCGRGEPCTRPRFLGVDVDGGFASHLRVPASALIPAPGIPDLRGVAYVEPVAATLAILGAGIDPGERGVIIGSGRIATLARGVLAGRGFDRVTIHDPDRDPPPAEDAWDFAIETRTDPAALAVMIRGLRRRGLIVLKSRQPQPVLLPVRELLAKELRLALAHYGSFADAVQLVRDEGDNLEELFWTEPRPLADFAAVLAEAAAGEGKKLFFACDDPEDRRCVGSSAPSA